MKNVICFFLWICVLTSCFPNNKKLKWALQQAEENRVELEKVLNHYQNDPLKYKAARYLIENMPYHIVVREYFLSPKGEEYVPDLRLFESDKEVKSHCDSLIRLGYTVRKERLPDPVTLTAGQLIENIELAFQVWEKPWAKAVSFEDFCRYILPYRATVEPYSDLRKRIMERYLPLLEEASPENAFEAARVINEQLKSEIRYADTGSPLTATIDDTYYSGRSHCEGLCNLGVFVMRAVGIPATVDYTVWVKMSLAHYWGVILHEGQFHPFGPGEHNPGDFLEKTYSNYQRVAAKVYRFRFDPVLPAKKYNDHFPHFLKSPKITDVTHEYPAQPIRLVVEADKEVDDKTVPVYVSAINWGQWLVIAIGERTGRECIFENIVGNNLFIIQEATKEGNLRYISAPFYVDSVGNVSKFIPEGVKQESFSHVRYEPSGRERFLQYWNIDRDIFITIEPDLITDTSKVYFQLPENTFLKYLVTGSQLARPVIIKNGKGQTY